LEEVGLIFGPAREDNLEDARDVPILWTVLLGRSREHLVERRRNERRTVPRDTREVAERPNDEAPEEPVECPDEVRTARRSAESFGDHFMGDVRKRERRDSSACRIPLRQLATKRLYEDARLPDPGPARTTVRRFFFISSSASDCGFVKVSLMRTEARG
jgi:hypothetical protein